MQNVIHWITENFALIVAGIGILSTGGFYALVKKAIKENKDAYKQGEIILVKIKKYKADGFNQSEIKDLVHEFEKFAKEGQEALEINMKLWNMVKNVFVKKKAK